jgi:hypothetical protein
LCSPTQPLLQPPSLAAVAGNPLAAAPLGGMPGKGKKACSTPCFNPCSSCSTPCLLLAWLPPLGLYSRSWWWWGSEVRSRLESFALMVVWRKADDHPLALAAAGLVGGDVLVTRVCWDKW